MVLADHVDVQERTVTSLSDNTPAVAQFRKGSTTTAGPAAFLNRLMSLHQRHHRYLSQHFHIAKKANTMADDYSCLWNLNDDKLLTYFNLNYPQTTPWKLVQVPYIFISETICALRSKHFSPLPLLARLPTRLRHGHSGKVSAPNWEPTCTLSQSPNPSSTSLSSPSATVTEPLLSTENRSQLDAWRPSYVPLAKHLPCWVNATTNLLFPMCLTSG